jgi:hypothetical protein
MSEQEQQESQVPLKVERVQVGARMEKRMVQVLKGLAEFKNMTLGELLEEIVLHSFEPVPGHEGQMTASAHGKRSLQAIADLKRVYGMDYDTHANYRFADPGGAPGEPVLAQLGAQLGEGDMPSQPSARRVS